MKAAAVGDVWRLAVLIALGVNADGINEYGQVREVMELLNSTENDHKRNNSEETIDDR